MPRNKYLYENSMLANKVTCSIRKEKRLEDKEKKSGHKLKNGVKSRLLKAGTKSVSVY